MKFSTLLVQVTDITDEQVRYITKPGQPGQPNREYTHIIPALSQFPFDDVEVGQHYCLISVLPERTWFWFMAYPLSVNNNVLVDESLTEYLNKL